MNEAGLVVELMWMDGSRYPDPDARGALGCLQWIQYQLDMAATVEEVLDSDSCVRKDLPVPALTNSTYDSSMGYLDRLRQEGGPAATGNGSLDRFARITARVRELDQVSESKAVDHAFETLSLVAQGSYTQWSIVYELDTLCVSFRTSRNRAIRTLDLDDVEFGCGMPVLVVDLHQGPAGDVRPLLNPYTAEINLELVRASYRKTRFLSETPDAVLRRQANYPATTTCMN